MHFEGRSYFQCENLAHHAIDSGLVGSKKLGRGAARAEDAQGTPTQSHIPPSILVYEDELLPPHSFCPHEATQF